MSKAGLPRRTGSRPLLFKVPIFYDCFLSSAGGAVCARCLPGLVTGVPRGLPDGRSVHLHSVYAPGGSSRQAGGAAGLCDVSLRSWFPAAVQAGRLRRRRDCESSAVLRCPAAVQAGRLAEAAGLFEVSAVLRCPAAVQVGRLAKAAGLCEVSLRFWFPAAVQAGRLAEAAGLCEISAVLWCPAAVQAGRLAEAAGCMISLQFLCPAALQAGRLAEQRGAPPTGRAARQWLHTDRGGAPSGRLVPADS